MLTTRDAARSDELTTTDHLAGTRREVSAQTFTAHLTAGTPTHPDLLRAARGQGADHDTLHYAVKDGTEAVLDGALDLLAADPATWDVLAPALASAPELSHAQRARLITVLTSGTQTHDPASIELLTDLIDDLLDSEPSCPRDVLDTLTATLTQPSPGAGLLPTYALALLTES